MELQANMDRRLNLKWYRRKRIRWLLLSFLPVGALVGLFLTSNATSKLKIDQDRLTIGVADYEGFQEYITLSATVVPIRTFYLDVAVGGRVQEISTKAGSPVDEGDTIVVLSNMSLLLDVTSRGAQLLEQSNNLRNTRLNMEQRTLDLESSLLRIELERNAATRRLERDEVLNARGLISREEYISSLEYVEYYNRQLKLAQLAMQRDSVFCSAQTEMLDSSLMAVQENLKLVRQNLDQLAIRAPVSGRLTSLLAELGQSLSPGMRIGMIDDLKGYKIQADIDEYYLSQIHVGQQGHSVSDRDSLRVAVSMVYPEVMDRRFKADLDFIEGRIPDLKPGQTVRIRLDLADETKCLVLPQGGFMQSTGGAWVYMVDNSGEYAVRRNIQTGRQNPQQVEVLSGLKPGDRVVISSYETFKEAERLILTD